MKQLWGYLSWFAGGYMVYKQVMALNEAKEELYSNLSPEQKIMWDNVFGMPGKYIETNFNAFKMPEIIKVPPPTGTIEQVKAGV